MNITTASGLIDAVPMPTPPTETPLAWLNITAVNHDKAWNVLRRLEREQLLMLFSRALRFVPPESLGAIFRDHAHPHEIGEAQHVERPRLLDAVRAFVEAARRGEYYQDFRVNSHNCTDKSAGTQTFEAQLDLLFRPLGTTAISQRHDVPISDRYGSGGAKPCGHIRPR